MSHLQINGSALLDDIIENIYKTDVFTKIPLLADNTLLTEALKLLEQSRGIEIDNDPYGPSLINLRVAIENLDQSIFTQNERDTVNRYIRADSKQHSWIISALTKLKEQQDAEWEEQDEEEEEEEENAEGNGEQSDTWEPLPLDRQDTNLIKVIESVDDLVEAVRGDNGYGVAHSHEKRFVLDKLQAAAKTLKEETAISWMYLREFVWKPAVIIAERFGAAALGIIAETAKAAVKDWLKKKGVNFLDDL